MFDTGGGSADAAMRPEYLAAPLGVDPGDGLGPVLLLREGVAEVSRAALGAEFAVDAPVDSRQHAALERLSDLGYQEGEGLTDGEVLEVMAAWSRQVAAAELQVREWAAVLARRPTMSPMWRSSSGARCDTAADEVGLRLGISRRLGQRLIDEGQVLGDVLSPVAEELATGRIDAGKASILVEALGEQDPHVAVAVCEQVLPVADGLDHAGLRRRVQAVIVQADPGGAMTRHQRAVRLRRVNRVRMRADGMASFSAVLAAPDAVALEQACEAAARAARATRAAGAASEVDAGKAGAGDGRTLEQLRADALVSMGVRALSEGCLPLLPVADRQGARGEAVPVVFSGRTAGLTVIATSRVQEGRDGEATLADVALHDIYDWEPDPRDPRGVGSAGPEASVVDLSGARADLCADEGDDARADLCADDDARADLCADEADLDAVRLVTGATSRPHVRQALDPGPDPYVDWDSPPTYRPGIDAPELVGYGAIAPGVVRALIGAASWVTVVEPVFPDADPPPSTRSYRPSAELDRHVRVRDVTCVVPGCLVPASRCDLDHHVPWPLGPTSATNLHVLCRQHHLLKTHAGHDLTVLDDGTIRWRTALGQVVWRRADGSIGRGDPDDPADRRPVPWGRTRAVPQLSGAEVERRMRDLEDAERDDRGFDDRAFDDLWPDDRRGDPPWACDPWADGHPGAAGTHLARWAP